VRSLTEPEARVLASMLGNGSATERDRLRSLDIPRSTYHAIRRRAYAEGWLRDRYVPAPSAVGRPYVTFALARPFADRIQDSAQAWRSRPGNVLLWTGPLLSLGVFFDSSPSDDEATRARVADGTSSSWSFALTCDSREPTVPVYFDFEGAWNHLSHGPGTVGYPRGLLSLEPDRPGGPARPIGRRDQWAIGQLLARPFVASEQGRPGHLLGPLGLPWAQRRVIETGRVGHRVLADPARIPPFRGQLADRVVFVTGSLVEGASPRALFEELSTVCRVFPFLYATDGARLLVGALGSGAPQTRAGEERTSVIATFRRAIREIDILEQSVSELTVVVDHRYDRLVGPETSGTSAGPTGAGTESSALSGPPGRSTAALR
jgi:hypothetical protein